MTFLVATSFISMQRDCGRVGAGETVLIRSASLHLLSVCSGKARQPSSSSDKVRDAAEAKLVGRVGSPGQLPASAG